MTKKIIKKFIFLCKDYFARLANV